MRSISVVYVHSCQYKIYMHASKKKQLRKDEYNSIKILAPRKRSFLGKPKVVYTFLLLSSRVVSVTFHTYIVRAFINIWYE